MNKNFSKNLTTWKNFDHAKQSATDAFKTTSRRKIQKAAQIVVDLVDNKIANEFRKVSRTWPQNDLETENTECDKENVKKDLYLQKKDNKLLRN